MSAYPQIVVAFHSQFIEKIERHLAKGVAAAQPAGERKVVPASARQPADHKSAVQGAESPQSRGVGPAAANLSSTLQREPPFGQSDQPAPHTNPCIQRPAIRKKRQS